MNTRATPEGRLTGFHPVSPEDDERYGRIFELTREANDYLIEHNAELGEKYAGEWVGIDASGVVAHHPDPAEFQRLLKEKGKDGEATVRFFFLRRDVKYIFSSCA
ncbi:MAG TPA: DUF5678 domain-containing protein [Dehalococcoidia bacterium]|nr:DUF5678 domain-containing protein [Dehalococcoidia bacterium]